MLYLHHSLEFGKVSMCMMAARTIFGELFCKNINKGYIVVGRPPQHVAFCVCESVKHFVKTVKTSFLPSGGS